MKQKTTQALFAYWNELRGERFAPARFEIEPSRIADLLPETFVLERLDSETYRYRLAGTRICEDFRLDFRERNFLDGWSAADAATLARALETMSTQGAVGVLTVEAAPLKLRREACFEMLLLPLTHSQGRVDRYLGSCTAIDPPDWLGADPLERRRLLEHVLVFPDGRPYQAVANMHRQSPFLPHVRHARIVRADRRQFRVYDGGLAKPADDGPKRA